jgi:hypothetical protein
MRKTVIWLAIIAVSGGPSIAVAGSISTFHRSWTHTSHTKRSLNGKSKQGASGPSVVENDSASTDQSSAATKTNARSTKSTDNTVESTRKTADITSGHTSPIASEGI